MLKKPKAWDRQAILGEGPKAHELFLGYCELGAARTCPLLAEQTGRKPKTVSYLCSKFEWVKRARAWDKHLLTIRQKSIENQTKNEAVYWAEQDALYRHEAFAFSKKLKEKAQEMLATPLFKTIITETKTITVGGETVEVPVTIIQEPMKWSFKDMTALADFSDKLRRMSLGVPTSRTAIEVGKSMSLEERVVQAKALMTDWLQTKLDSAVERVLLDDPTQDPSKVRALITAEAPTWFSKDWQIPDPTLLTAGEMEYTPPLPLEEESIN